MKAVCLFSGGLDSQLAVCLVKAQGIEVEAVNFSSPFFGGGSKIAESAEELGIALKTIDISDEYIPVLKNPRYGYGKNMNPCIDCHSFMIRKAGEYMPETGASFIITGEVLGQRPMSQNRSAMGAVEKLSGFPGMIVRPLSARLLPPTIPENNGWIDRERLSDIKGRSRSRQMELAASFGITDYPTPAGGCLLTMENYSRRLRLLLESHAEAAAADMEILKHGRHFWNNGYLLIIGRNQTDNLNLQSFVRPSDYLLKVTTHPGPVALLRSFNPVGIEDLEWAAALTARYSDAVTLPSANVRITKDDGETVEIDVVPLSRDKTPIPV
ncbi:MAG: hypothetical protein ACM3MK_12115 [Chitinophagales bacterium]